MGRIRSGEGEFLRLYSTEKIATEKGQRHGVMEYWSTGVMEGWSGGYTKEQKPGLSKTKGLE